MFTNGYMIASMAVIDKLLLSGVRVKVSKWYSWYISSANEDTSSNTSYQEHWYTS